MSIIINDTIINNPEPIVTHALGSNRCITCDGEGFEVYLSIFAILSRIRVSDKKYIMAIKALARWGENVNLRNVILAYKDIGMNAMIRKIIAPTTDVIHPTPALMYYLEYGTPKYTLGNIKGRIPLRAGKNKTWRRFITDRDIENAVKIYLKTDDNEFANIIACIFIKN